MGWDEEWIPLLVLRWFVPGVASVAGAIAVPLQPTGLCLSRTSTLLTVSPTELLDSTMRWRWLLGGSRWLVEDLVFHWTVVFAEVSLIARGPPLYLYYLQFLSWI